MARLLHAVRAIVAATLLMVAAAGVPSSASASQELGLVDQNGKGFSDTSLTGGWHLVYFGYTNCPDVCPTSLFEMTAAIDLLPEASRSAVTPVFVTVDPARDSAQRMADYVKPLGHGFVTVSGPVEATDRFAFRHKIVAVRNGVPGEDYSVDHSSFVLLFDPGGQEVERFPYEMDYHEVARRIAGHMAAAPLVR